MAALNISDLLNALSTSHGDKFVRAEVSTWLGAAPAKAAKKSKPKAVAKSAASDDDSSAAEDKPKRLQSDGQKAWNAFINHVCGPKGGETSGFSAWLESHEGIKGNKRMVYAKEMRGEDDTEYNAFKAEFKSSSSASASSADGGAAPAEKPKRKPGRPKKATASAAAGAGGAELSLSDSESEEEKEKPKPKPKQMAKKAPGAPKKAPKPSVLPPLPASDDESDITRIELFGQEFFWDQEDGGALYEVAASKFGGVRGEKVGTYDGHSAHFG